MLDPDSVGYNWQVEGGSWPENEPRVSRSENCPEEARSFTPVLPTMESRSSSQSPPVLGYRNSQEERDSLAGVLTRASLDQEDLEQKNAQLVETQKTAHVKQILSDLDSELTYLDAGLERLRDHKAWREARGI